MNNKGLLWHQIKYSMMVLLCLIACPAAAITTQAQHAILLDYATGKVLFEYHADDPFPPGGLTSIAIIYDVFHRLQKGTLNKNTPLTVSKYAWRKGGTRMFLDVNSSAKVDDLIKGLVVDIANDAAVTLAEGLGKTETDYAAYLTSVLQDLGLTTSTLVNVTGFPSLRHQMTARDLGFLARELILRHPDLYNRYFSMREFTYNGIRQYNSNPLLAKSLGADGMQVGYLKSHGYSIVGVAKQGQQRLIVVLSGLPTKASRAREAEKLLQWGFRSYTTKRIATAGQPLIKANVWLGQQAAVALNTKEDVYATNLQEQFQALSVMAEFKEPLAAPLKPDVPVGDLIIKGPDAKEQRYPLFVQEPVERANSFLSLKAALGYILWGHN